MSHITPARVTLILPDGGEVAVMVDQLDIRERRDIQDIQGGPAESRVELTGWADTITYPASDARLLAEAVRRGDALAARALADEVMLSPTPPGFVPRQALEARLKSATATAWLEAADAIHTLAKEYREAGLEGDALVLDDAIARVVRAGNEATRAALAPTPAPAAPAR